MEKVGCFQSDLVAPLSRREEMELSLQPNVHMVEQWALQNNRVGHVKVQEKINTIKRLVSLYFPISDTFNDTVEFYVILVTRINFFDYYLSKQMDEIR